MKNNIETEKGKTWYDLVVNSNQAEGMCTTNCGSGFRLPNQRELMLLATKCGLAENSTVPILSKTTTSYWPGGGFENMNNTSALGYWVGGYILNPWQDGVTLNPGSWYNGTEYQYANKQDAKYHLRCVKDIQ